MEDVSQRKDNVDVEDDKAVILDLLKEQHDDCLIELTKKRKTYPRTIRKNVAKEYYSHMEHLKKSKFRETSVPTPKDVKLPECLLKEEMLKKAHSTFAKVASLSKAVPALGERAQHLEKSYRLYLSLADCPTHSSYRTSPAHLKRKALTQQNLPALRSELRTEYNVIISSDRLSKRLRLSNT